MFQGRYKSILVDKGSYLLELSRYVHLNPVRAGIVARPEDYAYSSYPSFVGRQEEPFLSTQAILAMVAPHGNLSRVMQYLNGTYSTYINAKRKRRGHLFQGRYKSILVDKVSYLLELSRYVHLNPVRAGIVARPEDYAYSSYPSFVGRQEEPFLSTQAILAMVATHRSAARSRYREYVESALGEEMESPLNAAADDVVQRTGGVYAGLSRHGGIMAASITESKILIIL